MAEAAPEKSRGLKFAEQQLLRHGWEQGKGLGRDEDGIAQAIKVKVKCGKGGVGHKESEQFTFHWWDHVFNKASASLQVESDQHGIKLKKSVEEEEEEEGMISNKKPRKALLAKAKLYGCFVKSATLLSGQEQPEPKASNSDDSSSSEEDHDEDRTLDLSSTTNLSDADLMRVCGGRTAHKGARHGLTMSAKLARLEQQEAEFMAKYSKKSQTAASSPTAPTAEPSRQQSDGTAEESKTKRKEAARGVQEENGEEMDTEEEKKKKKKKRKKASVSEDKDEMPAAVSTEKELSHVENGDMDDCQLKRKHKKKKRVAEQNGEVMEVTAAEPQAQMDAEIKKKKKSKHNSEPVVEVEESRDAKCSQSETVQDVARKAKKKKAAATTEEAEVTEGQSTEKHKRKTCKEDKRTSDDEELPPKMKKKKRKQSKELE
ncbi:G patch domain-containing protein 4 [Genypterus blacodes]|uniref:G patch domain-containing protein 4 n=1 Tax=Genypterus blacodes TaxID=154954 RepID=UPI003F76070A